MRHDRQQKPALIEYIFRLGFFPMFRRFWKPKLIGGSYLPIERPCFVYGNHSNNFDPFILNMFTRWGDSTAGVLTQEYFRSPIMRHFMTSIRLLPTRKHLPDPHLIRKLYQKIDRKESILIYPEGGRRWSGRPTPWIESTAKIFIKSGIPIYPIVTHGSYVSWPRWATYPRPAKIRIEMLEPFVFERKAPFEEALRKLKAPLDFDESIVPDELKPRWAYKPAAGIHRLLYRDPETGQNGGIYTPDGTYVVNRADTLKYKMLPDSMLLNEQSGELITTSVLHDRVQSLPLEPDRDGAIIKNRVRLHVEDAFPNLDDFGDVEITLYSDAVVIKGADIERRIGLESIHLPGVERNSKLQLFTKDDMVQFTFGEEGSALQWQETIKRIKRNETVLPAKDTPAQV